MKNLLFLLLAAFSYTCLNASVKQDTILYAANKFGKLNKGNKALEYVDKNPEFLGGDRVMSSFFDQYLVYSESVDTTGLKNNTVWLKMIVTDKGKITNISVMNSLHPAYDAEAIRVMSLVTLSPGEKKGIPVFTEMIYPVAFRKIKSKVELKVDKMPVFPGGEAAMVNYIRQTLKYPVRAQQDRVEGRVVVRFVVGKDGSVRDAVVVRGIHPECDAEALRVVLSMPKWEPGIMNNEPVAVYFNIPFQFRLPERTPSPTLQNRSTFRRF